MEREITPLFDGATTEADAETIKLVPNQMANTYRIIPVDFDTEAKTLSIAIAEQRVPYRWVDAMNRPFLRLRFGDIRRYGLKWAGQGPLARIIECGRTPLIDIGTMQEIKSGRIRVFGPIVRTEGRRVLFGDGVSEEFDAIVLATGFRSALDDLLPDCAVRFGESGHPQRGDLHPGGDGLYFCGFHVVPTGHLRQIGMEAQAIASKIVGMH